MSAEINQLKNMIDDAKEEDTLWVTKALDKFGDELTSILSSPAKLLGQIVKGVGSLFKKNLSFQRNYRAWIYVLASFRYACFVQQSFKYKKWLLEDINVWTILDKVNVWTF